MRKLATYVLLMVMLLVSASPPLALAQDAPPAPAAPRPKDTPIAVGEGAGRYLQAAAPALTGAFDRAVGEIDAASPDTMTPRQVKDLSFRRRILELRLLMDLNAFAYDKDRIKAYRDVVDRAYESVGTFQDLADIEKELGVPVNPDVIASRRAEMLDGLGPFRNPAFRNELRGFFTAPLRAIRTNGGPHLWDITETRASNEYDAVGNAALLQTGIVRKLQNSDLGVSDIFDPNQAYYFHTIRKEMRDVVLLSAMYPAIKDQTRDVIKPLDDLVGDYGDVLEAFTAYQYAQQAGLDTEKVAAELRREFERAMTFKGQMVDQHLLDAAAIRLNGIRDSHR